MPVRVRRGVVGLLSALLLVAGTPAVAGPDDGTAHWQTLTENMSPRDYERACRNNKRIVRNFLKTGSMNALSSAGIPEVGARLVGAAAGLAASLATNHDVKLGLNDGRTLFMELKDPNDDDPALMLRYRLRW